MNVDKENIIKRELYNYECFFNEDPLQALQSLKHLNIKENEIIKVYNKLSGEELPLMSNKVDNLIVKHENIRIKVKEWNKKNKLDKNKHKKFKVGDKIIFLSGYHNNIRYKSEIMGIEGDSLYVLWDCFWSPIRHEKKYKIKIVG
jgi:hypothetical protein